MFNNESRINSKFYWWITAQVQALDYGCKRRIISIRLRLLRQVHLLLRTWSEQVQSIFSKSVKSELELKVKFRIPTLKLKIPGNSIFEIRIPNFCYIQVIVFDIKLFTSGSCWDLASTLPWKFYEMTWMRQKFWFRISKMLFPGIFNFTVGILFWIRFHMRTTYES